MCEQTMFLLGQLNKRFDTDSVFVAVVVEEESVTVYGELYQCIAVKSSVEFKNLIGSREVLVDRWPAQKQIPDCTMVDYSSARFGLTPPYTIVFMYLGKVKIVL